MEIVKTKKTSLRSPLSASDVNMVVASFQNHKGTPVTISDFDDLFVVVVRQGSTIEMILCDGITQNSDGSATLDIATNGRDLSASYPYAGSASGEDFGSGAEVVNGNDPYTMYQITKAYAQSVALAGAPNGDEDTQGVFEEATSAEIDAETATGETGARLAVTAENLGASKYGTRLPTQQQKDFLGGVTGMITPYAGDTAPSGFLMCDGQEITNNSYSALIAVLKGRYGYNTGVTCTAGTDDLITAVSHGLNDGDIVFFSSTVALPTGLSANTIYYVRDSLTNTFKVSTSVGGAVVDITSTGTGVHSFHTSNKVPNLQGSVPIGQGANILRTDSIAYTAVTNVPFGTVTAINSSSDYLTLSATPTFGNGTPVILQGAEYGWTSGVTYYAIVYSGNTIRIYDNQADAIAGNGSYKQITGTGSISASIYLKPTFTVPTLPAQLITGHRVSISTTGAFPTNITAGDYYIIRISDTTFSIASSEADAIAGIPVGVGTGLGSGTHTIVYSTAIRAVGDTGGEVEHKLTVEEMPSHTHTGIDYPGTNIDSSDSGSNNANAGTTGSAGGDTPHNNMQPFVVMSYIIKT